MREPLSTAQDRTVTRSPVAAERFRAVHRTLPTVSAGYLEAGGGGEDAGAALPAGRAVRGEELRGLVVVESVVTAGLAAALAAAHVTPDTGDGRHQLHQGEEDRHHRRQAPRHPGSQSTQTSDFFTLFTSCRPHFLVSFLIPSCCLICCLPPDADLFLLLSAACCLLSAACCLLPAVCCLLSAACQWQYCVPDWVSAGVRPDCRPAGDCLQILLHSSFLHTNTSPRQNFSNALQYRYVLCVVVSLIARIDWIV